MATKYIYKFTLTTTEKSKELVDEVLDDGRTVKVEKEVEKVTPIEFGLKKPTKAQKDEIDLSYKAHFSEAVRRKVMPIAELQKQINDNDGVFSKKEIQRKKDIIDLFTTTQTELSQLKDAEAPEFKTLVAKLQSYLTELDEINQKEASLYNQSAEGYAKNKIIFEILALNSVRLSDNTDFFKGATLEEKLETIQDLDENGSEFDRKALKLFYSAITFYFSNDRVTQEDLDNALKPVFSE